MLSASPHLGRNLAVKIHGLCALGVSNSDDIVDSATSGEANLVAAFTGRLDNSQEIAANTTAAGFRPASDNPADIIVSAFQAFGPDAPDRFRGAFAAVITDGRQFWCFRDHIGLRSGFYRDDPRGVFVASEAKQIVAGGGVSREPNMEE